MWYITYSTMSFPPIPPEQAPDILTIEAIESVLPGPDITIIGPIKALIAYLKDHRDTFQPVHLAVYVSCDRDVGDYMHEARKITYRQMIAYGMKKMIIETTTLDQGDITPVVITPVDLPADIRVTRSWVVSLGRSSKYTGIAVYGMDAKLYCGMMNVHMYRVDKSTDTDSETIRTMKVAGYHQYLETVGGRVDTLTTLVNNLTTVPSASEKSNDSADCVSGLTSAAQRLVEIKAITVALADERVRLLESMQAMIALL